MIECVLYTGEGWIDAPTVQACAKVGLEAAPCSLSEAIGRAGFVLVFETMSFPRWGETTRRVIDLTQRDLGNGGARSEPPRYVLELGACGIVVAHRDGDVRPPGWYGMVRRPTGGDKDYVSWFRTRYRYETPSWIAAWVEEAGATVLAVVGGVDYPGAEVAVEEFLGAMLEVK